LYAEDSIVKYLKQYQIKIKHSYVIDHYGRVGDLFLLLDGKKLGHLHYSVDSSIKNLHIDKIKIDSKLRGDIKFSKLILIYVLSFYAKRILTVSLAEEYSCFYQTLGFELSLHYLQVDMKALLPNLVRSLESLVIHVIRN